MENYEKDLEFSTHCDLVTLYDIYLAQVMARCLMALSHFRDQYWVIINGIMWLTQKINLSIRKMRLKYRCNCTSTSPRGQRVNEPWTGNQKHEMWWRCMSCIVRIHNVEHRAFINLTLVIFCVFLVCPQQGATTITQLELVPRPEGIANLRCDFNVPPDPTHTDTGFLYIAWVIDTTSQLYTHLYDPDDIVSKAPWGSTY